MSGGGGRGNAKTVFKPYSTVAWDSPGGMLLVGDNTWYTFQDPRWGIFIRV